jgi:hypothetical protein
MLDGDTPLDLRDEPPLLRHSSMRKEHANRLADGLGGAVAEQPFGG